MQNNKQSELYSSGDRLRREFYGYIWNKGMTKIITWIDLQGRYRVTSPAYNDITRPPEETEDETIAKVLVKIKKHYSLPDTHVFHFVEDAAQRDRIVPLVGTRFRYGIFDTDARAGAWEMDVDGHPKVNIPKARIIHMDRIRIVRDEELRRLDVEYMRANEIRDQIEKDRIATLKQTLRDIPQTFDLSIHTTPEELDAAWPTELPR